MAAAFVPAAGLARFLMRRRGARRNAEARCASCESEWTAGSAESVDAFLVEGHLVCKDCASKLRKRTIGAGVTFAGLTPLTLLALSGPLLAVWTSVGIVDAIAGMTVWGWSLFLPPIVLLGGVDWSIRRMKRLNQAALQAVVRARLLVEPVRAITPIPEIGRSRDA